MAGKSIKVTITKDGETQVEAYGYKGKGCLKATQDLEVALGGGIVKRSSKPEMNQPPDIADRTNIGK